MQLITWNVNGLRACWNKGFLDFLKVTDPDVICVQETKMQPGQAEFDLAGWHEYWNSAVRKGYSGTAVFTKRQPVEAIRDIGIEEHGTEGRALTLDYGEFYLVTAYSPNSQEGLKRLDYRLRWEDDFRAYLQGLDAQKPVVICGDLNVAHEEIDLKNPKTNRQSAGFSDDERAKFTQLLEAGFADTFRRLNPGVTGVYTWWSYKFNARKHNAGWRIDYFLVSERILDRVKSVTIYSDVYGSDHCPVGMDIDI